MDKAQALYKFWSGFDLPAYDEYSVPTGDQQPKLPYITYNTVTDSFDNVVQMSASLWYRSTSWAEISNKAEEIARSIGSGGITIKIDNGYVYICRGQPFAQRMAEPSDSMIRRIYINIQAEYLTAN